MASFSYNTAAELFPAAIRKKKRAGFAYRRFGTAAEAVRFAIEELPADSLNGAYLQVDEARFDQSGIRTLYASCLLTRDLFGKPLRTFPDPALARLPVDPAPQDPHVADVGAEQHIERIAREWHRPGQALDRDIAEHPRRDVPGRAERARLAHQPQRDRGHDDIADHRDQSDDAVDTVADVGTWQDEGDVQKLRQCIEPRQPLLAREIAERIGVCISEIEPEAAKLRP